MAVERCLNCVYCIVDPQEWLHAIWLREPLLPQCANHPCWPGRLHDVSGIACRNYRPKPVLPKGDAVRLIPLGDGFYAYVDAADYEWLSKYTWHLNNGYASRREKGRRIYLHAEIMRPPKGMVVDHIDGNMANDCRFNLRICTQAENLHNRRHRHGVHSRFTGVGYSKEHNKWYAQCRDSGRRHWLGYFDEDVEAARAYDRKAVELFGEFARLNFPEEWPPQRRAEVHAQHPHAAESSSARLRRGESSFARKPVRPPQSKGKTARGTGDGVKGKSKKAKSKKPRAETQGRRDRKPTTKRPSQKARKKSGARKE